MSNNTLSDREIRRIAKVVIDYERFVKVPFAKRDPPLVDSGGSGGASMQFTIDSLERKTTGPYTGLQAAQVTIKVAPPGRETLIGTSAEVIDWSSDGEGCVFDLPEVDLIDVWGWATEYVGLSQASGAGPTDYTPKHWGADDRCCTPADGGA